MRPPINNPASAPDVTDSPTAASVVRISALLAAFKYRPQIRICMKDGTCKKMTPELLATMPNNHQEKYKMAFAFQAPRPELYDCGPRYCGKKPGVCSGQHCREIHCS